MGSIVGVGQGDCARVLFVSRKCIENEPAVSFVCSALEDTGSLGFPPRQVVYPLVLWFHLG